METFTGTTQEIADKMGVDYGTANAIIKLLVARKLAKEDGVRANSTGRGRGATLFVVPLKPITLKLFP